MRTKTITVHAKSIDHALKKAALDLGVAKEDIEYELISQTDAGLLSFLGGRRVEIKAWSSKVVPPPVKATPSRRAQIEEEDEINREPLEGRELEDLVEDLRSFCAGVCRFIAETPEVAVTASLEDERLTLNIDNEDLAQQIGKNSRLAESLEHILRKKPRYLKRELPFRIFVDARGIRASRELELVEMAKDLSLKVAENQRPIVLNYKSSYDRKIIHMALDKDERVYTKSIGTGANRKLMILPVKDDGQDHGESTQL
jgi:spoIIIJ-associated protein